MKKLAKPDGMWIRVPVPPEQAARAQEHVERIGKILDLGRELLGTLVESVAAFDRDMRHAERAIRVRKRPDRKAGRRTPRARG